MTAMECRTAHAGLTGVERELPAPGPGEVLVEVAACGVCRTDLHVLDGEIPARYPVVPGHEIVGRVAALGEGVDQLALGDRVGVPWLGRTCGACRYCREGRENLCDAPLFTGATRDGGYATHTIADAAFCFALPEALDDSTAAPLLCAGLIGWRAYRMAGEARRLGLYGFGAAAHLLAQVAIHQAREVFAFTRAGDAGGQAFARSLGCAWAGGSDETPPAELDAAILFAPVGALVPVALRAVGKGGRVVCAGIHMSEIPAFAYADLWGERGIVSVANLTRADGVEFLALAGEIGLRPTVTAFPLTDADEAIVRVRNGTLDGTAVLVPDIAKRNA
ncbi:MAG: zinc-dependent alcohol dehydrogenase family protein [Novosphingobium sp.]|nr:zinc-dependent alcohol dehydrogenase family protein [Novosphingobium sp.]